MSKIITSWVGIDNGVTGSIGICYNNGTSAFLPTPVVKTRNYTKKESFLKRIDWNELYINIPVNSFVLLERPMVNPKAFISTESALRALEATLIALEMRNFKLGVDYDYIDSKQWQREFISSSILGHDEMKEASRKIGIELFPNHTSKINKHGDADGILIAAYCQRIYSQALSK